MFQLIRSLYAHYGTTIDPSAEDVGDSTQSVEDDTPIIEEPVESMEQDLVVTTIADSINVPDGDPIQMDADDEAGSDRLLPVEMPVPEQQLHGAASYHLHDMDLAVNSPATPTHTIQSILEDPPATTISDNGDDWGIPWVFTPPPQGPGAVTVPPTETMNIQPSVPVVVHSTTAVDLHPPPPPGGTTQRHLSTRSQQQPTQAQILKARRTNKTR